MTDPAALAHLIRPHALEDIRARDLLNHYGPLLGQDDLWRALGYASLDGLRQAQARGTLPVRVFSLENRRGKFAPARDVAKWLTINSLCPEGGPAELAAAPTSAHNASDGPAAPAGT